MHTATNPPRYPLHLPDHVTNLGGGTRPVCWLTVLLVSFTVSIVASAGLHGREIDYRSVDLAGHMQPWPVAESEIPALAFRSVPTQAPTPTQTGRTQTEPAQIKANQTSSGADDWRTTLTAQREASRSLDPSKLPSKQPGSALEVERGNVVGRGNVEILVVPQTPTSESNRAQWPIPDQQALPAKPLPSSRPRDCYRAPSLSVLSTSIALPAGKLPTNAAAECASQIAPTGDARLAGAWAGTEFHWSATCLRHRPLYFEEINAERYGYTVSTLLQPVISAAHFFATIPALPYKMAFDRPRDCIYTLGQYRPGSCAPRRWNRLPWQLTAGVVETGLIAAMILLIP